MISLNQAGRAVSLPAAVNEQRGQIRSPPEPIPASLFSVPAHAEA
jgi:hypothetical protein